MAQRKPQGWKGEPARHAQAARGIVTARPVPSHLKGRIPDPQRDLIVHLRGMKKFRPHWDFEVDGEPVLLSKKELQAARAMLGFE